MYGKWVTDPARDLIVNGAFGVISECSDTLSYKEFKKSMHG